MFIGGQRLLCLAVIHWESIISWIIDKCLYSFILASSSGIDFRNSGIGGYSFYDTVNWKTNKQTKQTGILKWFPKKHLETL